MHSARRLYFETKIKSLEGFEFQGFMVKLFFLKYGESGFTALRKKKDNGCDGIIIAEGCVIACYGPEKYTDKKFEKKVKDDFEDFQNFWENKYSKWMFVFNQELSPYHIGVINDIKADAILYGIQNILTIIDNLNSHQRRKIGEYLNIPKEFLSSDILGGLLEDLLKGTSSDAEIEYDNVGRINFQEKVLINFAGKDIQETLDEYFLLIEDGILKQIADALYCLDDQEIGRLKRKILFEYSICTGNCKEKMKQLTTSYLLKYANENDDEYLQYIRGLLFSIFEQCLIGDKTTNEHSRVK